MLRARWLLAALTILACDEGRPQPPPFTPSARDASVIANGDGSVALPDAATFPDAAVVPEPDGMATCEQYVRCVAASNPGALGLISGQYTAGGTCWMTTPELCESACITGLRQSHQAFPRTAECPACVADRHCEEQGAPACDAQAGECVGCTGDNDCSTGAPACDLATSSCVACTNRSYCPQSAPACDLRTQQCEECLIDADCPAATPGCIAAEKRCVACTRDEHCSGATPICGGNNTCVACSRDEDCPGDRPICNVPLFGGVPQCVECAFLGGGCAASETCRSNMCQPLDCAGISTECGPFDFADGVHLECGTCTNPQQMCLPRMISSMVTRNVCGMPIDSGCDPRQPDICGRRARCVWDPPAAPEVGECVNDVTSTSCTGPNDRACIYEGHLGGITNFGTCVAMRCRPLCSVDAHCRNGGTCQMQPNGAMACVE